MKTANYGSCTFVLFSVKIRASSRLSLKILGLQIKLSLIPVNLETSNNSDNYQVCHGHETDEKQSTFLKFNLLSLKNL